MIDPTRNQQILDEFFERLRTARRRALLLDYDGTLAPFRVERDQAVPYAGVRERLCALQAASHTRVVIISGRAARDLIPLLGIDPIPEIWASHGWEHRLAEGRIEIPPMPESVETGLEAAADWAERQDWRERLERKPACLALHWRGLAEHEITQMRGLTKENWSALACRHELALRPFDGGMELRAPGRHKGHAVLAVLKEMNQDAAVAYLGDDLTDEDAFRALADRGLTVLVRPEPWPTAARAWLKPPEQLLAFFDRWLQLPAADDQPNQLKR